MSRDQGDEDDIVVPNPPHCVPKNVARAWASLGFRGVRYGKPIILFAAERVPSDSDHDPGDEEPRMRPLRGLIRYFATWRVCE